MRVGERVRGCQVERAELRRFGEGEEGICMKLARRGSALGSEEERSVNRWRVVVVDGGRVCWLGGLSWRCVLLGDEEEGGDGGRGGRGAGVTVMDRQVSQATAKEGDVQPSGYVADDLLGVSTVRASFGGAGAGKRKSSEEQRSGDGGAIVEVELQIHWLLSASERMRP